MDHGFTMTVSEGAERPDWDNFEGTSWTVTLRRRGRQFTLPFHQGSAHTEPPKVEDVVYCVLSDISPIEAGSTFEDWCGDYGYDTDSRKAWRTYGECVRMAASMRRLIGEDLDELLEMFQDY